MDNSLGSHDLSAMRELLGMPTSVLGASLQYNSPIWSVLFQYPSFPCTYESGINNVPIFDAHIEVYSSEKIVRINYDTPYVKGLPVTMTVRERINNGEREGDGYQERTIRVSVIHAIVYFVFVKDQFSGSSRELACESILGP
jgi:predicted dehydrogenase